MSRRVHSTARAPGTMSGREYFLGKERELRIENVDPASLQETGEPATPKLGKRTSRVGGRIATDLKHLTAEETAKRQARSKAFLSQPAKHFPADEVTDRQTNGS